MTSQFTNHLARETSPYLLQHARNPVDWYAWGPEAFAAAREQNKPIFLSVGYSTCYWCHVMERQSFENENIATLMNELFINIKVDREERPDVDQLYMTAVQLLTRQGGWPMSVWLTPDLRPFHGGTYFPPDDQWGRPGFAKICRAMADAYRHRLGEVDQAADHLVKVLQRLALPQPAEEPIQIDSDFVDALVNRSVADFDPDLGGFGSAPKFPRETLLELLLASEGKSYQDMALRSLDAMADGGIRDHLGGGFHRYSTDAQWLVPHFEVMLYDNAMLGTCYIEAYRHTAELRYATVARGIFDFILREMTSPDGAFYTALDAEVDGQEGLNYLWTATEIVEILGTDDAKLFNKIYGLSTGPNFADPHHGEGVKEKNILHLPRPMRDMAAEMNLTEVELDAQLAPLRAQLYAVRKSRKQPLLDRKILTSWNGLMIRALARAGEVLQEERYLLAAARAATFLLLQHRTPDGSLIRSSGGGLPGSEPSQIMAPPILGALDDYAFFARALLQLRNSEGEEIWKDHAATVVMKMIELFGDDTGGFFYTPAGETDLIVRQMSATDSPLPSGNAVAVECLIELGLFDRAQQTLARFAPVMVQQGEAMSSMIQATRTLLKQKKAFSVEKSNSQPETGRPPAPEKQVAEIVRLSVQQTASDELRVRVEIADGYHLYAPGPIT